MDKAALLARYDAEVRARPAAQPGIVVEHTPALTRLTGSFNFVLESRETLMALDVARAAQADWAETRHDVRRVRDLAGLEDFMRASQAAFGVAEPWRRDAYAGRLGEATLGLFVAYIAGQPVGAARLERVADDFFGELFGGGVVPAQRGRGVYTSLAAHAAGVRYLTVGGNAQSAPRLARLGFVELSPTECWVLPARGTE